MKKLIVIRHGQSVGNDLGIIQGNSEDYGLTTQGQNDIEDTCKKNVVEISTANRIVCSPFQRAIESAEIISKNFGKPIVIDEQIKELNPGILSGMKKANLKDNYPELFEIWRDRGDLDNIPSAEKGNELQARAIGFLMQYIDKEDFCDVIVSHAGFIRSLINTIDGKERTNKIDTPNGSISIRNDIFENLKITPKDRAMNSKVYIIETANGKYVVKIKNREISESDYQERDILKNMSLDHENLPIILSMSNYSNSRSCKVLKFVEGNHKYGKLSNDELIALLHAEKELASKLKKEKGKNFPEKDISSELNTKLFLAKNKYVREMARKLIAEDKRWQTSKQEYVLSHTDLNRDNILFQWDIKGKVKVNIVDWESLEYAPKGYQLAGLLASGLLLEGENINQIIDIIKKSFENPEYIIHLMQVRLFEGFFFFAENREISAFRDENVSEDLQKRYFFANEILEIKKCEMEVMKKKRKD